VASVRPQEIARPSGARSGLECLRALAQRVEVADREVRIIGSKGNLRQTLTAAAGVKPATPGVRSSGHEVAEGMGFEPTIRLLTV